MKTISDFKVVNNIALLEGVAYAEEAKVVEDYLKNNNHINQVSIVSNDGRNFELKNGKLVLSSVQTFLNPYFIKEIPAINKDVEERKSISSDNFGDSIMNIHDIEFELKTQELKIENINSLIKEISKLLNSYIQDKKEL